VDANSARLAATYRDRLSSLKLFGHDGQSNLESANRLISLIPGPVEAALSLVIKGAQICVIVDRLELCRRHASIFWLRTSRDYPYACPGIL
jgi:hypothetical protein